MKLQGVVVLLYGILILAGGLTGYLIADNWKTLLSGAILGALLIAGGCGLLRKSIVALYLSFITAALLTLFFLARLWLTGRPSSAVMAFCSIAVAFMLFTTKRKSTSLKS